MTTAIHNPQSALGNGPAHLTRGGQMNGIVAAAGPAEYGNVKHRVKICSRRQMEVSYRTREPSSLPRPGTMDGRITGP
jgi:hypothetical protein